MASQRRHEDGQARRAPSTTPDAEYDAPQNGVPLQPVAPDPYYDHPEHDRSDHDHSELRPRSVAPAYNTDVVHHRHQSTRRGRSPSALDCSRSRSRSTSPVQQRDRASSSSGPRNPLGRAGGVLRDNLSGSKTGIGVGLLGAAMGAWAAHEASGSSNRRRRDPDDYDGSYDGGGGEAGPREFSKSQLAMTVLGAVVGGLGANAIEKRIESSRGRGGGRQDRGRDRDQDPTPFYDDDHEFYRDDRHAGSARRENSRRLIEDSYTEKRRRRSQSRDPSK